MNSYMILIVCRAGESFPAFRLGTLVRSFAGMRSNVNLSNITSGKRASATVEWAQKRTFPGMCPNVFQQISGSLKTLIACFGWTLVRLFSGMRTQMCFQTISCREILFTFGMRTSVWSLTSMRSFVHLEMMRRTVNF